MIRLLGWSPDLLLDVKMRGAPVVGCPACQRDGGGRRGRRQGCEWDRGRGSAMGYDTGLRRGEPGVAEL